MRRLLPALAALVVAVVAILALAGGGADAGGTASADKPRCDADDQLLAMELTRNGRGRGSSPEDAVERDVHSDYSNLPPSAFRRSRSASDAVELVHERNGRRLVVVETVEVEGGWAVESMLACNKVLVEGRGR